MIVSAVVDVAVALAVGVAALAVRPRRRRVDPSAPAIRPSAGRLLVAWSSRTSRRTTPDARAVASWCDDLVREVRSGSTLREALTKVPDDDATARATAPIRIAIDRGLGTSDAVERVADGGPHVRLALGVLAVASRLGGPAAAAIDRTAMALRQRAADLDERSTQAAQARLSAHVMTAVPLLMLGLLVATDGDVRSVAVSPIGAACIATGLGLNATGWWWMHRIVRNAS